MIKHANLLPLWVFILCFPLLLQSQSGMVKQIKLSQFGMQSSAVSNTGGEILSTPAYVSKGYWFPVTVPTTVLSGLVANKVYPDPYTGMNNLLIPDASDSFNHIWNLEQYSYLPNDPNPWKKPYWFRTNFSVPAADKGRTFQLIFKGINYRAEVWLNGKRIADSAQMAGMFAEYDLNVSSRINAGGDNILAVKIYPLDFPGLPSHPQLKAFGDFYENGGPNGDIGKNVTMLSSAGWDWIPEVKDRNIGIWQPVYLRTTDEVVISKPHIITDLPFLPDTGTAALSLNLTLKNNSNESRSGQLKIMISPENFEGNTISFGQAISLKGLDSTMLSLNSTKISSLLIRQPHLWWPNGYGKPNLYRIRLQYAIGDHISDDTSFLFGIRTTTSRSVDVGGFTRRDFYVNGKKVHLVGGAWVPDMMLNRDSLRYAYELDLCRNANANLIRIWGGGLGETDDFYELADRYGLMVWQDFWITGDTNGGFKGSESYPLESSVFINNVISTIYRIRNHASLLVWTGGNEGHAREELFNAMRDQVAALDGTRTFIPCSSGFAHLPKTWKQSWPDNKPSGVYSGGPYSWLDPKEYYRLVNAGKEWLFKDETGIPSQPPYNSFSKVIVNPVHDTTLPYPLNNSWGYHDACSGNGKFDSYYYEMVKRYGEGKSLKDFSSKMQLMNADGYRGIFEAVGHKLNETGGVMLWKLNPAFPSVIWQIYDWFLEPNAGYYFMQNACEPVHIQLNLDDSAVTVINRTYSPQPDLGFQAEIFDMNGTSVFKKEGIISLKTSDVQKVLALAPVFKNYKGIHFLVLNLLDKNRQALSHNMYWMAPGNDFKELPELSASRIQTTVIKSSGTADACSWTFSVKNVSNQLAFFLNPQLWSNNDEVMPSYWSSNYFSLAPGESTIISVRCPREKLQGNPPTLKIEGWNIADQLQSLSLPEKN